MKPVIYTSTLPSDLIEMLENYAVRFKIPKNRIIERSLRAYFDRLKEAEYVRSFRKAAGDQEVLDLAEEGMDDYLKILDRE